MTDTPAHRAAQALERHLLEDLRQNGTQLAQRVADAPPRLAARISVSWSLVTEAAANCTGTDHLDPRALQEFRSAVTHHLLDRLAHRTSLLHPTPTLASLRDQIAALTAAQHRRLTENAHKGDAWLAYPSGLHLVHAQNQNVQLTTLLRADASDPDTAYRTLAVIADLANHLAFALSRFVDQADTTSLKTRPTTKPPHPPASPPAT